MPYVTRNAAGEIVAVASETTSIAGEWLAPEAPELQDFLARLLPATEFDRSDQSLIRVVEDIVNTLIDKNLIRFTDLPPAAQQKLARRRSMRQALGDLDLLGDGPAAGPEIKL